MWRVFSEKLKIRNIEILSLKRSSVVLSFLISGIVVLCFGFLLLNCGTGPQLKTLSEKGACAVEFGTLNYISASKSENLANSDITVEAWIKRTATTTAAIFSRGGANGIALYASGTPAYFKARGVNVSSTGTIINDGIWHHIAGVLSTGHRGHATTSGRTCTAAIMTGNHIDIYVDGVFIDCNGAVTFPDDAAIDTDANTGGPYSNLIGYDYYSYLSLGGSTFMGVIDEVRLWREARDKSVLLLATSTNYINAYKDTEITAANWNQANPNGALIGYWKLNECSGSSCIDSSGYMKSGIKQYCIGNCSATLIDILWDGGWVTGYPF